jgi:hypothetical protein
MLHFTYSTANLLHISVLCVTHLNATQSFSRSQQQEGSFLYGCLDAWIWEREVPKRRYRVTDSCVISPKSEDLAYHSFHKLVFVSPIQKLKVYETVILPVILYGCCETFLEIGVSNQGHTITQNRPNLGAQYLCFKLLLGPSHQNNTSASKRCQIQGTKRFPLLNTDIQTTATFYFKHYS